MCKGSPRDYEIKKNDQNKNTPALASKKNTNLTIN